MASAPSRRIWGERIAHKISLGAAADGTHGGRRAPPDNVSAVEADPVGLHLGDKELPRLQQIGKDAEPVPVDLLDPGHIGKEMEMCIRDRRE